MQTTFSARTRTTALALSLFAIPMSVWFTPTTAAARSNPQDEAQLHYDEGVRLYDAAEFKEAATEFELAYALVPDASLLYNIGLAWEEAGELDKALDSYQRYVAKSPEDASELEPQIRALEYRIQKRDDATAAAAANKATSTPSADPDAPTPHDPPPQATPADRPSIVTPLIGTLLGVGAIGLATGTGLAVAAQKHSNNLETNCTAGNDGKVVCPSDMQKDADQARGFAIGADITFAVGGAALVTGVSLLAVRAARARHNKTTSRLQLSPNWAPRKGGSMMLSGRF